MMRPLFDEEFWNVAKKAKCDGDIEKIFGARCIGRADDVLPVNPYGYRAWVWVGKYKNRDAMIISWDLGNSYAEVIDFFFINEKEKEMLLSVQQ